MRKNNVIDVYLEIENAINSKRPLSVIRLGDGEGAVLAYPDILGENEIRRSYTCWLGNDIPSSSHALELSNAMRRAVKAADIVGLPRDKQIQKHPHYKAVMDAIQHYNLLTSEHVVTDAALHRYLQFTLLYRKILRNQEFVGVISPRDISTHLVQGFGVKKVVQYKIKGERKFEGQESTRHFPEKYYELYENLEVPYQGAIFLVGAGGFGKIYCHWLKERGAIAIDMGAILDAWTNVKSRLVHPSHSFDRYAEYPEIAFEDALIRFNMLCDHFQLDTERLSVGDYPSLHHSNW